MKDKIKAIRYVTQDGQDFYIFRDAAMTDLQTTWRAHTRVRDFDLAAASKAREECIAQLRFAGYEIQWPNPFASSESGE